MSACLSNLSEEALTGCGKRGYVLQINGTERSGAAAFTRTMSSESISSSNPSSNGDSPKQNINPSLLPKSHPYQLQEEMVGQ
ncbi:hypothetical protein D5086_010537 [Populus alba]|uniref:Uncharacterized protein n=1 Tax=Populus alba TaxID=43335 RepID=A0ACC4CC89_POPAL